MIKEKKTGATWWMGLTFFITATLIPYIIAALAVLFIFPTPDGVPQSAMAELVSSLIALALMWPGIMYSAKYIRKTYAPGKMMEVVLWGTVFFNSSFAYNSTSSNSLSDPFMYIAVLVAIGGLIYFYQLSKKYLMAE